jgi:hypothetical protein
VAPRSLALPALAAALLLAGTIRAQSVFYQNKLEFMNWWVSDREDLFPNFLAASGNLFGDGLFKVLPAEILERAENHRVSGYKIAFSIDDAFVVRNPFLASLPGLQIYRTKVQTLGGKSYETIDPARKVGPEFDPVQVVLPNDGTWLVEMAFDPFAGDPKLQQLLSIPALDGGKRAGLALLVLAPPGEKRSTTSPGIVLQSSYLERHIQPGATTYSGSYNAGTQAVSMFGMPGMPSASGELHAALRFDNPTLQLLGSGSGGYTSDPQGFETYAGPGAYATDLGSALKAGFFGFYVQDAKHDTTGSATHLAYPFLVSQSAAGPTATIDVFGVKMRVNPAELAACDAFIQAGLFGAIKRYAPAGAAGWDAEQKGVWTSGKVALPPSPALIGANLWLSALITTVGMQPVAATNVVRLTIR